MDNRRLSADIVRTLREEGLHAAVAAVTGPPPAVDPALYDYFADVDDSPLARALLQLSAIGDWRAVYVLLTTLPLPRPAWMDVVVQLAALSTLNGAAINSLHRDAVFRLLFPTAQQVAADLGALPMPHDVSVALSDTIPGHMRVVRHYAQHAGLPLYLADTLFDPDDPDAQLEAVLQSLPDAAVRALPLSTFRSAFDSEPFQGSLRALRAFLSRRPDIDLNRADEDGRPAWFGMRAWMVTAMAAAAHDGRDSLEGVDLDLLIPEERSNGEVRAWPLLGHRLAGAILESGFFGHSNEQAVSDLLALGVQPLDEATAAMPPFDSGAQRLLRRWRAAVSPLVHPLFGALTAEALADAGLRLQPGDLEAIATRLRQPGDVARIAEAFERVRRWNRRMQLLQALGDAQEAAAGAGGGEEEEAPRRRRQRRAPVEEERVGAGAGAGAGAARMPAPALHLLFERTPKPDADSKRIVHELAGLVALYLGGRRR